MNPTGKTSAEVEAIREVGKSISSVTNGGNYVAMFWCDYLPGVHDLDDAIAAINKQYTNSKLQKEDITPVEDWSAAWKEIAERVWYGVDVNDGNEPNRAPLTQERISELSQKRDHLKLLLDKLVDENAKLYTFGWSKRLRDYINLDDYIVQWAYRFITINPDGDAYLLHGSASD